ncbi:hypothetical protein ACWKSP_26175 [Micromonosporaceae bacterium Da 78-11]
MTAATLARQDVKRAALVREILSRQRGDGHRAVEAGDLPGETTKVIDQELRDAVAGPLPERAPGAALAGVQAVRHRVKPRWRVLEVGLRALGMRGAR